MKKANFGAKIINSMQIFLNVPFANFLKQSHICLNHVPY